MFKYLLLLGKPASGKGSFSQRLTNHYTQLSTGDILRNEIKKKTKLGNYIKSLIDDGKFVDNDTMLQLLQENLPKDENIIFDGYPRNKDQIDYFNKLVKPEELLVIHFNIPDEELIKRVSGRRVCSSCNEIYHTEYKPPHIENICDKCEGEVIQRKDDKINTFKQRLKEYDNQTLDVIKYYSKYPNYMELGLDADINDIISVII